MFTCASSALYLSFVMVGFCISDRGKDRSCAESLCEHNCTQLPEGGFICSCRPGFKPNSIDRNLCEGRVYFLQFLLGEPCTLHSFPFIKHGLIPCMGLSSCQLSFFRAVSPVSGIALGDSSSSVMSVKLM